MPPYRGQSDRGQSDRGRSDRGYSDRGRSDRGYSDRGYGGRGPSRGSRDQRTPQIPAETLEQTRSLIEYLAQNLVDNAERVSVRQASIGGAGVVYELSVAPEDMGRIIGKQGRVANAIRALLKAAASRMGARVTLEIV